MVLRNLIWSFVIGIFLGSLSLAQVSNVELKAVGSFPEDTGLLTKAFSENGIPEIVEYFYGVGSYSTCLVKVDHPNNLVSSAELFESDFGPFYGAASSGSPEFFWATRGGFREEGTGSALLKVYPAEKAIVQVGEGYGQNHRYPGDPNYVINIRELAYNDDTGVLYGTDYLGLYTIDTSVGVASHLGDFGNGVDGDLIDNVFSMEYDRLGKTLFIINQKLDGFIRKETHLYSVDMATGVPTFVSGKGASGITDIYQSHLSDVMVGSANLDNRFYKIDTLTGAATLQGEIANNMLGLGGEFPEVPGPQVWFQGASGSPKVTVYSELDGERVSNGAAGYIRKDSSCQAEALKQESGQPEGVGQLSSIYSRINYNHDLSKSYFHIDADFSSSYNGSNMWGTGGAQVELEWNGTMKIVPDQVYPQGTKVIVLVDGSQLINDMTSHYVMDWELKVIDPDSQMPVMVLTEDSIPLVDSTPFLGAFHAAVGNSSGYGDTYQVELDMTVDIDLLAGDFNNDGFVDLFDFEKVAAGWLAENCDSGNMWCSGSDVDGDGNVNISDLPLFAADWLQGSGWGVQNSFNLDMDFVFRSIAVPESIQTLNDECADSIRIMPNTEYFGSTKNATGTDESSCNNNDVYDLWYRITPQQSGVYKIHVENISQDTISPCISVYDSCGGTELYCWENWDSNRFFEADEWVEYFIRIAGNNGSQGDFKIAVVHYPSPENDNCDNPVELYMDSWFGGDNFGATNDSSSSCGYGDTADVWYSYTPEQTGNVIIRLESYEYTDFNVSVFDSCDEFSRQELACANSSDIGGWPATQLGFEVVEDQTYLIRVAANEGLYDGFDLYLEPGPENDKCEDAIELTMWDSQYSTTVGTTGEDITSCGFDDNKDVWYKYTADYDHLVVFDVYDDSYLGFPLVVGVFDSCDGNELVCSESGGDCYEGGCSAKAIYEISSGETVYIRVAFSEDFSGAFQLNVDEAYPPDNDECDFAEPMDGWVEGSTIGSSGDSEGSCGLGGDFYDVWYTYSPMATGYYYIYLDSSEVPIEGTLSIFDGDECSLLTEIDCTEISYSGELYLELDQDKTYYIRVASYEWAQVPFYLDVYQEGFDD